MKIGNLEIGSEAKIIGYEQGSKAYRQKLLRMGLVKGCRLRLLRKAPMGDPVEIELNGQKLTLRKSEADVLIIDTAD
ncbi:MAG: ferrous iron transport protein A [Candidatus Aegiribacteria sp.]|nr:ferrous iron transport protein A [Candidatus Aegiribacteria sp.]